MPRSQRRIVASLLLLIILSLWIWGAATIGSQLSTAPKWASLAFYVVAGIGWALPMKPIFNWMNSGEER